MEEWKFVGLNNILSIGRASVFVMPCDALFFAYETCEPFVAGITD
jgi:hypothetical protein